MTAASISMADASTTCLPKSAATPFRNRTFGFIFQFYHLLPEFNTLENVLTPAMISHSMWSWFMNRRESSQTWLANAGLESGLSHRLNHKPKEPCRAARCSGRRSPRQVDQSGRRASFWPMSRRVPRRRERPACDEVLRDLNQQEGLTIVMVTHNLELVHDTDRVVRMFDGRIERPENISLPTGCCETQQEAREWRFGNCQHSFHFALRSAYASLWLNAGRPKRDSDGNPQDLHQRQILRQARRQDQRLRSRPALRRRRLRRHSHLFGQGVQTQRTRRAASFEKPPAASSSKCRSGRTR